MGLLDFFRRKSCKNQTDDLSASEKALLSKISKINARGGDITPDLYQQLRDFEMNWLERHYDFNSIEGIDAIPDKNPYRPPTNGVTGAVYYYLRRKGYQHEDDGNTDLAIACLRKSVAILKCTNYFSADEAYPLVKVLARAGHIDEAYKEKSAIDAYISTTEQNIDRQLAHRTRVSAKSLGTDLVIMDAHGSTCPECAKYQGRVYSVSGRSRKFPKVPAFFFTVGVVHGDCSHTFWPYIDGVNDPGLEHTLSVHPLQNKAYGKDIVTFSNRPFVDDRTEACKKEAAAVCEKEMKEQLKQQDYYDHMIETEARRGQEARDFRWLQTNLPDKCPKSISGFRRMKTQNTKNYQALKQAAAELGRDI